jgi:hypothetical protein
MDQCFDRAEHTTTQIVQWRRREVKPLSCAPKAGKKSSGAMEGMFFGNVTAKHARSRDAGHGPEMSFATAIYAKAMPTGFSLKFHPIKPRLLR